uniref:Uncharacterized protein n=1 Tax=Anguilla anguilla TaxID=7936 RepID=A0A0E9WFG5_ANGAN
MTLSFSNGDSANRLSHIQDSYIFLWNVQSALDRENLCLNHIYRSYIELHTTEYT